MIENKFNVQREENSKSLHPITFTIANINLALNDVLAINLAIWLLNMADSDLDKFTPLWNQQFKEKKEETKNE